MGQIGLIASEELFFDRGHDNNILCTPEWLVFNQGHEVEVGSQDRMARPTCINYVIVAASWHLSFRATCNGSIKMWKATKS